MKKILVFGFLILVLFLALGISGCVMYRIPVAVPGVQVTTSFPYNQYQVSVENNIPGTFMAVKLNGVVVKTNISVGQNWVGGFYNFGTRSRMTVVAVFTDPRGNWVGMTRPRTFYFSGYESRAEAWVVSQYDLQR